MTVAALVIVIALIALFEGTIGAIRATSMAMLWPATFCAALSCALLWIAIAWWVSGTSPKLDFAKACADLNHYAEQRGSYSWLCS